MALGQQQEFGPVTPNNLKTGSRRLREAKTMFLPHVRQKLSNESELFFAEERGLLRTVFGILLVVAGLGLVCYGIVASMIGSTASASSGLFFLPAMGCGVLLAGLRRLLWTNPLRLNLRDRTYGRRYGVASPGRTMTGSFDDFSHVASREDRLRPVWAAELVWKTRQQPPDILARSMDEREVRELQEQLAVKLGRPTRT